MAGYAKVFSDIVHSTVWREDVYTKVVWITMLVMADRHGLVMSSIPGLADAAKVSLEQCLSALEVLSSPDKYSRTKEFEGRRIDEVDGGWLLLNYEKFRSRKDDEEQRIRTADRVRRHRLKLLGRTETDNVTENVTVTQSNPIAETSSTASANSKAIKDIFVLPEWIDVKAWTEWEKFRIERKKPLSDLSRKKCVAVLEKHKGQQKEIIDLSIMNGWTGLFPPKSRGQNGTHQQDTRSRAKRFSDKLDDIARRDIEKNGFTDKLD